MGSKPKVCKCGHDKALHKGKSKLSIATYCRQCPCSSYLNRKRPDKMDYVSLVIISIISALLISVSVVFVMEADPAMTGTENDPVTFTKGELYDLLYLFLVGTNLFFVFWFVLDPLFDVMQMRKRKEFPTSDPDEL